MTKGATIDDIVMKLLDVCGIGPETKMVISSQRFVALMSVEPSPAYGSVRTIREKWQVLHALGYLVPVNSKASRVNVEKIYGEVVPRVRPSMVSEVGE